MIPMDHAEAHERIADLALEPARLGALDESGSAEDAALRDHVESCPRCQGELANWHTFHGATRAALASNRHEQLHPIVPPEDLRARVLQAARDEQRSQPRPKPIAGLARQSRRWPISGGASLALAAVFALVVAGLGMLAVRDQSVRLDATLMESRWLSGTVSALSRVLAAPNHNAATLRAADGTGVGAIAWTGHDLVVLANGLPAPATGQVYSCWLTDGNTETAVGKMWFVDGDAFWFSSADEWAPIELDPQKQFLVTLESSSNTTDRHAGRVVLQADLDG